MGFSKSCGNEGVPNDKGGRYDDVSCMFMIFLFTLELLVSKNCFKTRHGSKMAHQNLLVPYCNIVVWWCSWKVCSVSSKRMAFGSL